MPEKKRKSFLKRVEERKAGSPPQPMGNGTVGEAAPAPTDQPESANSPSRKRDKTKKKPKTEEDD